ncbi:hypothetical protein ABEB36_013071 [Hypothenemus hampei]|uniref:Uncharacterized protein n=1 Tax=Hypothenemus hampei TaxID=57062 RepID=A0ABD1E7K0_HYPHA
MALWTFLVQEKDFEEVHLARGSKRSTKQVNYNTKVLMNPIDSFTQNMEIKKGKPDDYSNGSEMEIKMKKNVGEQPIKKYTETDVIDLDNGYSNKFEINKVEKLDEDISPVFNVETPSAEAKEREAVLAHQDLLFCSITLA